MRTLRLLASLLLFAVSITFSFAQQATTSVRGTVTDPQGRVVTNATVTLTDPARAFTRNAQTNAEGAYQIIEVPPSTYTMTAKAPGFGEAKRENVQLLVSTPATVNFAMKVEASTIVEVTGATAMVNTQDATVGNAFDPNRVQNLPMEGRHVGEILSLQPGVVYTGSIDNKSLDPTVDSRNGAVNGGRSDQTNITLDGVDDNDQISGFAFTPALRSTVDSVQEFRITTADANADMGRSSGGQLSLVTKSGTNKFHGTLYEYHRPTFTSANDWFNKAAQVQANEPNTPGKELRNTFGGSIGGPIWKDRIFFFGNYEGERLRESTQVTRIVPSLSMRQGEIKYVSNGNVVTLTQADILTMDPNCTGNGTCPQGPGVDPAMLPILQGYPAPNSNSLGDGLNTQAFTFAAPAPANLNTYIARLDFKLTQDGRHNVYVRGNLQHDHDATLNADAPQFPGLAPNELSTNTNHGVAIGYTALLTTHLVNSFRYGYVRQTGGLRGTETLPEISFRGLDSPFGTPSNTTSTIVPVHNFIDDVTWTRGKHTWQFGTNLRVVNDLRSSNLHSFSDGITNVSWLDNASIANSGSSLDPAAFGFPAVDSDFASNFDNSMIVLAGLVPEVDTQFNLDKQLNALSQGAFVNRHFRDHEWEFYGQDAWHIRPNLTLTGGLRYTILQPPYETTGTQVSPDVSLHDFFNKRASNMFQGIPYNPLISFSLSGQANGKKPYWGYDWADVAPRFAFAYSPGSDKGFWGKLFGGPGKTSIRGGYGIYYDHFGEGIVNTFDRQGSFGLSTLETNPAGTQDVDCTPRLTSLTVLPTGTFCGQNLTPTPPSGSFPVTPPSDLFAITWGLDDKLKTPYSHVFDFSVQRQLGKGFVMEAAYVGRLGRRLLVEKDLAMPLDLVDPKSGVDYFTAMDQLVRLANNNTPISAVGPIPYWQNLFPGAAGAAGISAGCGSGSPANPTATQNIYSLVTCPGLLGNETTTLFLLDGITGSCSAPVTPSCSKFGPNAYFDGQWSSLYAWSTSSNSSYNGLEMILRKSGHGLDFDFNYTYSHSIDTSSDTERVNEFEGFGFGDQIINSWDPNALKASSDFDARHNINANWIYELPYGEGKQWHGNSIMNNLFGGWGLTGLFRWSSGYPFSVGPGLGFWATNWQLTGDVILKDQNSRPDTGTFIFNTGANPGPNAFQAGHDATNLFRFALPGESGQRNELRGPGYFSVDSGLQKTWKIGESQSIKFDWEVFNVFNSVRFDVGTLQTGFNDSLVNSSSFGNYSSTLTIPRHMQFGLRYSF